MKTRKSISELPFNSRIVPGGEYVSIDVNRNHYGYGVKFAAIHTAQDFSKYIWFRRHTYYLSEGEQWN